MTIEEITGVPNLNPNDAIKVLQSRRLCVTPDIDTIRKEYYVKGHDVFNKKKRPDKIVKPDENTTKVEFVARIGLALQNIIVERAVAFLFGNEVKLIPSQTGGNYDLLVDAISRVNKDNKINAFNRQVARVMFTATEVAEYWYTVDADKNNNYGFSTDRKLKCAVFSPLKGDILYPYFDEYGDLIAFSRAYVISNNKGKQIQMFETWTDTEYRRFANTSGWQEVADAYQQLNTGKIPIVYANQPSPEWTNVQSLIDRLEKLLSNFADTNDYFASPLLFIQGKIEGFASKGESGKIIEGEPNSSAQYLAWSALPEPINLEINNLLNFIYSFTQTPNISFDNVKGLGTTISGETLKMLFLDAHLKVQNKLEVFDNYLTRRYNIIKAELKAMNKSLPTDLDLDNVVTPYMSNVDTTTIDNLVAAFQGGIMSLETAVQNNPYVEDATAELEKIQGNEVDKDQNT